MSKVVGLTGYGFIGSHVVDELLNRNYKVVVFDHHDKVKYLPEGVEFFLGDMRDATAMTEFAAHVDGILHLAAVLGTQETIFNPRPAVDSNLTGGLNFLEACSQYKLPGVYICVANHWMQNSYSISKTAVERFCHMFNNDREGRINLVRAVNCFGPRQTVATPFGSAKVRKIIPSFVCRALSGIPIEVYGDGEQISDCVYVKDVAKALVNAFEQADSGNIFKQVVEVGPKQNSTVNQVAELIRDLCHEQFGQSKVEITHLPMRPGEIAGAKVAADTSTLSLVGMEPKELKPLRDGLIETIQYFLEVEGTAWSKP